jgi:ATP-binding cassette subfamily B protein
MRRHATSSEPPPAGAAARGDWRTIKSLLPYLLAF